MLDALSKAAQLQRQAAAKGFDWPELDGGWAKGREELNELEQAGDDTAARYEELGDLLFAIVNLARHLKVEPTDAMIAANAKFERRFAYVEDAMAAAGKTLCAENLAAMDAAWDQAKAEERERA